jgi:hypothetical protein
MSGQMTRASTYSLSPTLFTQIATACANGCSKRERVRREALEASGARRRARDRADEAAPPRTRRRTGAGTRRTGSRQSRTPNLASLLSARFEPFVSRVCHDSDPGSRSGMPTMEMAAEAASRLGSHDRPRRSRFSCCLVRVQIAGQSQRKDEQWESSRSSSWVCWQARSRKR